MRNLSCCRPFDRAPTSKAATKPTTAPVERKHKQRQRQPEAYAGRVTLRYLSPSAASCGPELGNFLELRQVGVLSRGAGYGRAARRTEEDVEALRRELD